jgi:hypothetical protein
MRYIDDSDGDPPKELLEFPVGDGVRNYCGPQQEGGTDVVYVTPGYFDTLQMPLLAGKASVAVGNVGSLRSSLRFNWIGELCAALDVQSL